jgi:dihydrodiol dehydrogenase / D-xylose 1-dehydrogenase (NADP)
MDPAVRGVTDIKHTIVAAASSSSIDRAAEFLSEVGAPESARAYGSYDDLVKDPDIDIIYVATPHSHHFQNVMLCLEAGKNVLCEKAFTANAKQARILADVATKRGLFLMEALWTRYFPLTDYVREIIASEKIGQVTRVISNASARCNPETSWPDGKSRMVNPDLAGGALLDLGVYSLTWPFLVLYKAIPPKVSATMIKVREFHLKHSLLYGMMVKLIETSQYHGTSADETTSMLLTFPQPDGTAAQAFATTSIRLGRLPNDATPAVIIQGSKGTIHLDTLAQCPKHTKVILDDGTVEEKFWPQPGPGKGSGWYNGFLTHRNAEGEGQGMFWEADEAARALIEGRKEGKHQGLDETIAIMDVLDEVRRQGDLRYPDKVETTEYPISL